MCGQRTKAWWERCRNTCWFVIDRCGKNKRHGVAVKTSGHPDELEKSGSLILAGAQLYQEQARDEPAIEEMANFLRRCVMTQSIEFSALLAENRSRLHRMVHLRMDRRLQGRIDASDVIQEAYIEATERLEEYEQNPRMPPFLWLRWITAQRLLRIHRKHFGVQARDPRREISLFAGQMPEATSAALAAQLIGQNTSPSQAAIRAETKLQLQESLNALGELDREVLALKHSEQLTSGEIAVVLEISESAARKRYIRALRKLKAITAKIPGLERAAF